MHLPLPLVQGHGPWSTAQISGTKMGTLSNSRVLHVNNMEGMGLRNYGSDSK